MATRPGRAGWLVETARPGNRLPGWLPVGIDVVIAAVGTSVRSASSGGVASVARRTSSGRRAPAREVGHRSQDDKLGRGPASRGPLHKRRKPLF